MSLVCPLPATATDPAFARAIDRDVVIACMRAHLGAGELAIELVPDYVRWKDKDGSIVGWRAKVGAEATETYITVRTAPLERLRDEASKLEHREEDYDGLKSFALAEQEGLLLVAFPLDRQMSDLRRMVRASKVRTVVQENNPALIPDGMRFSKSKSSWQLVRYKPERRAVIRWDLGFKNDNKESMRTTTWMRMVAEAMPARTALAAAAAAAGIPVPALLASPHDRLFLETHLPGKPWHYLDRAPLDAVAATLARLHGATPPAGARVHSEAAELELARRAVDDIARLDRNHAQQAAAIAADLARAVPDAAAARVVHGDFHCGQVLLGDRIALCDFDRSCLGPVGADFAALHAHAVIEHGADGAAFAAEFAAAYARVGKAPDARTLAWWNACALLRTVTSPFRSLQADWPEASARILAAAAQAAKDAQSSHTPQAMTTHEAAAFERLQQGLPPLAPTTELILRPESERPVAILRPVGDAPRTFVLQGDDVVELIPRADDKLPAAPLLGDPMELCRVLSPFLGPVSSPRLVAWRPGKRAVVRLQVGTAVVFVKFLDKKTWRRAETTFRGLGDAAPPLHFARPSTLIPEYYGYAASTAPGRSLRDTLAAGAPIPWDLLSASIRSLRDVAVVPETPTHDFASARKAAGNMLRKASFVDSRLAELAERVDALQPPAKPQHGFVHGDLHDKQIFIAGDTTHLIDLEGIGSGDPLFDLANLAEHLRLRALQQTGVDDGSADELCKRNDLLGDDQRRWRMVVRARLAGVYALRPRWERLTQRLRTETETTLNELR